MVTVRRGNREPSRNILICDLLLVIQVRTPNYLHVYLCVLIIVLTVNIASLNQVVYDELINKADGKRELIKELTESSSVEKAMKT